MRKYLEKLPSEIKKIVLLAGNIAERNNLKAYLVGGFVRDLILGVKNFDLDIVVEGDGIKFAQDLSRALNGKIISHQRFGTASISFGAGLKLDIATARKEVYPEAAHLPQVSPGTLRDDLLRRDFTINTMAISLDSLDYGRMIDFFNGQKDLKAKVIRILHDLSFLDDPTRILRAARFQTRLKFRIEPHTLRLLKEAAGLKMIEKTHAHRLRDELILILKEKDPLKPLKRLEELAGLDFISDKLKISKSKAKLLGNITRKLEWFQANYPGRRRLDSWLVYFIGLLDDLSLKSVKEIAHKFGLRRGEEKRMVDFKKISPVFIRQLSQKKIKPSRIFKLLQPLSYEAIILLISKYPKVYLKRNIANFLEIYNGMRILISGDDLHRLGLAPGPYYQKIFSAVLKAKLEGIVRNRQEELDLIKKLIKGK